MSSHGIYTLLCRKQTTGTISSSIIYICFLYTSYTKVILLQYYTHSVFYYLFIYLIKTVLQCKHAIVVNGLKLVSIYSL